MGSQSSVCADLLEQLEWPEPPLASDFHHPGLVSYLQNTLLEVVVPVHAPQNDFNDSDQKAREYPRPGHVWEAYKMHLALIGPSSTCKKQFLEFLPKLVPMFRGTPAKLAPGRDAVPYHFMDSDLHRIVLWDLPEINFKQKSEDYLREIGLMYVDCCFMLFSEKYKLTDIYCKICVAMALHGIPFFVLCTQSEDGMDEKEIRKLQSSFQAQSVQVRMFNPSKPHDTLEPLINDFFKEISWNRSKGANSDRIKDASEAVLGQTVRIKNLEKKPELNGRCGVCVGFDKGAQRYVLRLITNGVESDVALKEQNFSILKPKLLGSMVQIKGLQSKPELNGRYGFVDEFLRENERYRIFVPDRPGVAQALALKSDNLEKVSSVTGAKPMAALPSSGAQKALPKPKATQVPAKKQSFSPPVRDKPKPTSTPASSGDAFKQPSEREEKNQNTQPAASIDEEDLSAFLPKMGVSADEGKDDLMSRIFAAEEEESHKAQAATKPVPSQPRRKLQFSLQGLLGMRVWAVVGSSEDAEDVVDHLMDCGKTVFNVGNLEEGAHFTSTAELNSDPNLPKTEVIAFIEPSSSAVLGALDDAARLGVSGILLHPSADAFGAEVVDECHRAGIVVHGVDIVSDVEPGTGIPVAPLD